jgi:hypothetical protein
MESLTALFAYVGPEVALPVASVVASLIGFVMVVGRAPFRFAARMIRIAGRDTRPTRRGLEPRATRPPDVR